MKLQPCPICGAKAYLKRDNPDGYFMGYSVGCPRYKRNDGIHSEACAFSFFDTEERAITYWYVFTENY